MEPTETMDPFASSIQHDSPSVRHLRINNTSLFVLGTAHVSQQSVEDVKTAATIYDVDSIAVELDKARYNKLTQQESTFENLDIFSILKQKKALYLFATIVLSSFQRRLGEELDVAPGAEMSAAIEECKARDIPCYLVDRPIDITLKRIWARSSFFGKQKIVAALLSMLFSREKVSEEQLHELKQTSLQSQMLKELSQFLPGLKKVLLDERDEYLATKLFQTAHTQKNGRMLVVLGAAHVKGVIAHLETYASEAQTEHSKNESVETEKLSSRLVQLEHIGSPRKFPSIFAFIFPLLIVALIVWGFVKNGPDVGMHNILVWYVLNGGLSFLGALISIAHPVTMFVAFLTAPISSLTPFVGVGFLTGFSEALMRKPRVKDIMGLQRFQFSIKAVYRNRVTRILLVFIATTLGSAVGTLIAIPKFF